MTDAIYVPEARPGLLGRIWRGLGECSLGAARLRQVEALRALSDEELAARGLTREEIVHHAFRDLYFA